MEQDGYADGVSIRFCSRNRRVTRVRKQTPFKRFRHAIDTIGDSNTQLASCTYARIMAHCWQRHMECPPLPNSICCNKRNAPSQRPECYLPFRPH